MLLLNKLCEHTVNQQNTAGARVSDTKGKIAAYLKIKFKKILDRVMVTTGNNKTKEVQMRLKHILSSQQQGKLKGHCKGLNVDFSPWFLSANNVML